MLDMKQKSTITKEIGKRYKKATKKQKTIMLGEFCAIKGYNRSYASWILAAKKEKVLGYFKIRRHKDRICCCKKTQNGKKFRIYKYDMGTYIIFLFPSL